MPIKGAPRTLNVPFVELLKTERSEIGGRSEGPKVDRVDVAIISSPCLIILRRLELNVS